MSKRIEIPENQIVNTAEGLGEDGRDDDQNRHNTGVRDFVSLDEDLRVEIAKRARGRRESLAITRRELAGKTGFSISMLGVHERRLPRIVSRTLIANWERALDLPPGWLLMEGSKNGDAAKDEREILATHQAMGARARARRLLLGLCQIEVAQQIGTGIARLSYWERGIVRKRIQDDVLGRWEKALSVPSGWLFSEDPMAFADAPPVAALVENATTRRRRPTSRRSSIAPGA
jgi:transcriptional regulator with XRE-family HTH domain